MDLDLEPLGDIFGPQRGGGSGGRPPDRGAPLEEIDFDPDRPLERPSGSAGRPQPPPEPPRAREAASEGAAAQRQQPSAHASVDPAELRRRIQGVGSEAPSLIQRARQLAAAGFTGGRERLREKVSESPRLALAAGLVVCLLLLAGTVWQLHANTAAQPDAAVLAEEGSDQRSRSSGQGSRGRWEDSGGEEGDDGKDREAAQEGGKAALRGKAPADARRWAKEFAELRRTIEEGNQGLREELQALRKEVATLRRRSGKRGSDRAAQGDADRSSSERSAGGSEAPPKRQSRQSRDDGEDSADEQPESQADEEADDEPRSKKAALGEIRKEAQGGEQRSRQGAPRGGGTAQRSDQARPSADRDQSGAGSRGVGDVYVR